MTFHYYEETDTLYISLTDSPGAEAVEVRPGIVLDLDEQGELVGIDIDHASRKVNLHRLEFDSFPVRSMAAAG